MRIKTKKQLKKLKDDIKRDLSPRYIKIGSLDDFKKKKDFILERLFAK